MSIEELSAIAVNAFQRAESRPIIFEGFMQIFSKLVAAQIAGDILIDGSFLTQEIEPLDADFALCVTSEFYEKSTPEQRQVMDWIGDEKKIKMEYLCDCYLCVEYLPGHAQYFDGIQNRAWWINHYRISKAVKRERGLALVNLGGLSK